MPLRNLPMSIAIHKTEVTKNEEGKVVKVALGKALASVDFPDVSKVRLSRKDYAKKCSELMACLHEQ
jgi:hypothetical protein